MKLRSLLLKLEDPLGFNEIIASEISLQNKFIESLTLPLYNEKTDYHYIDVLDALAMKIMAMENVFKDLDDNDKQELQ